MTINIFMVMEMAMDPAHIRAAFDKHGTDKGRDHGYEYLYANVFRNCDVKHLLEIGVEYGHSIAAWKDLFPNAHVTGIDVVEHKLVLPASSFNYIVGDSGDKNILDQACDHYDVIIDDASNDLFDQALTFSMFKYKFKHCYVIEDIYSSHSGQNDRVGVIEKYLYGSGFRHIERYMSRKQRNGKLLNTMALAVYRE